MGMNALEVRRRVMMAQPHEAVASGAVASFRTDVVSALPLEFDLLPIQDLHGQANPYPAGGGKNKIPYPYTTPDGTYSAVSFTTTGEKIVAKGTTNNSFLFTFGTATLPAGSYRMSTDGSHAGCQFRVIANDSNVAVLNPANNATNFTLDESQTVTFDMVRSATDIDINTHLWVEEGSTTTDFAPYSNICPISGHTGFTRNRAGKNLFNKNETPVITGKLILKASQVGEEPIYNQNLNYNVYSVKVKPLTTYTFGLIKANDPAWACIDKNGIITQKAANGGGTDGTYVTVTTGASDVAILLSVAVDGTYKCDDVLQFEEGNTHSDYESFTGVTKETTFPDPPETVYGGHVTDNGDGTGTLVVCKVEFIPTSVGGIGTASTGVKYISTYLPTGMNAKTESEYNECISSEYKFRGASAPPDSGWFRVQPNILYIFDDRFTDTATAGAILATEKPQFVYELATPISYTLPLDIIQSIVGQNNVWVYNADSVTVEYWGH